MAKVLVTGASGMLGRSVVEVMENSFTTEGWAFSRLNGGKFRKVDLTNKSDMVSHLQEFKPDVVLHCAAERRPDKVSKAPQESERLNRDAAADLAEATAKISEQTLFIYISTDYVFDGTNPPYSESATPNPVNDYGKQKLAGEKACLERVNASQLAILRVPILYGPVEFLGEGAIDSIFKLVLNKDVPCKVDDFQKRYPTHVNDVARVLKFMVDSHIKNPGSVTGIYHWSGTELFTKYSMAKVMDHLKADSEPPKPDAPVLRPSNAQLKCDKLIKLGVGCNKWSFLEGVKNAYEKYV